MQRDGVLQEEGLVVESRLSRALVAFFYGPRSTCESTLSQEV
jgi:hypothetical protein